MKVKTKCEYCGKIYQMEDAYIGRTAQCRNCQNQFTMALFEDQPGPPAGQPPRPYAAPPAPPAPPSHGAAPAYGGAPPAPAAPAYGAAAQGTPSQPRIDHQTVVCPKCNFTADIPRVGRKLKLRCQECGHRFMVKPEPKSGPGRPLPTEKAPREKGGSSKAPLILLLIIILAAVLVGGPALLPELFRDLGLPNILELF